MIHIRVDNNVENAQAMFVCGLTGKLPEGDKYFFASEDAAYRHADCPGCNPEGAKGIGTPLSQLSGRPGESGYEEFCRIARSWGYD